MLSIQVLASIGFVVSLYAYIVERNARNPNYKAFCDFTQSMSCTKAFTSPYGKLFGVSNALGGIIFYLVVLLLTFFGQSTFIFVLTLISFWGTLYLAYLSYFKMKNFCMVCNIIYLLNILLLIFAIRVLFSA